MEMEDTLWGEDQTETSPGMCLQMCETQSYWNVQQRNIQTKLSKLLWHSPPTAQFCARNLLLMCCLKDAVLLCWLAHWTIQRLGNGFLLHSFYGSNVTHLLFIDLLSPEHLLRTQCLSLGPQICWIFPTCWPLTYYFLLFRCSLLSLLG